MTEISANCKSCGKTFGFLRPAGTRGRLREFCSVACNRKVCGRRKGVFLECPTCKVQFQPRKGQRFCSIKCHRQLCDEPVERVEGASRNLRPSIDHVVPLARGGSHTRGNVQCAHWICNSRKSDSIGVFPQKTVHGQTNVQAH